MSWIISEWLLYLIIFCIGLCIGSFLNVCIYRLPLGCSIFYPPSHCAACGAQLLWRCNIPILSWLVLRGRAACCGARIDRRYPIVELLTGVGILTIWMKWTPLLALIYSLFFCGLVVASFIDWDHFIIPDEISLGGCAIGVVSSLFLPQMHEQALRIQALKESLLGLLVGIGGLLFVAMVGRLIFKKEAMGMGDVKLLGAMGAFLGWKGVLFIVPVASFLGSAVGLLLLLGRKKKLGVHIPFGPYLGAAAMLWLLGAKQWMLAYCVWSKSVL